MTAHQLDTNEPQLPQCNTPLWDRSVARGTLAILKHCTTLRNRTHQPQCREAWNATEESEILQSALCDWYHFEVLRTRNVMKLGKSYCGTLTESVVNTNYTSVSVTTLKLREGAFIDHRDIVLARSWASTSKRQRRSQVYHYNDL